MNLQRPTQINLQSEALANSKARLTRGTFAATCRVATRDARAHNMLEGLKPGETVHIASMSELSLHDVAGSIIEHYGPFETLTLSTWAASPEAIHRILALRQAGGVKRLEALVDSRMPTDCTEAHAMMASSFDAYVAGSNHSKIMAFTRFNMFTWNGCFALGKYVPMLSQTFQKKPQDPADMAHSRRVYNFKQQGKHIDEFKTAVENLKTHFCLDDVVAVPRSTTETSRLQDIFGVKIERTAEVTPRKANHKVPLAPNYTQTYTVHRDRIGGKRVLLVDDIATTGVTLMHFSEVLRAAGLEVIPAALAFDHKLPATWSSPGVAVVSTANLTRNPRCEVLVVTIDTQLAEFHRDWIREAMANA